MRVLIAGAERLGQEMAAALASNRNEVTIVEIDDAVAERLRGQTRARVVYGDACEPSVLEEAGGLKTDVLVAVTGEDQVNLVISLLAKRYFDVPRVVARINDSDNNWLFTEQWGVDVAVSASSTLLSLIEEATSISDTVGLLRLGKAGVGLIETTISEESSAVGKPLSDLELPSGTIIAAVVRNGQPTVPGGSFVLAPGDEILVVSETATAADIRRVFQR